jgi:hypothetical protein
MTTSRLNIPGTKKPEGEHEALETKGIKGAKMPYAAGVGTPDALKGARPVWEGLGGNRYPKRCPAPSFYLMFITTLFCQVDDHLPEIPKHPNASLWPSEAVTLGLLHALTGVGNRAFYRWLMRDYRALFPHVPERPRLFRLFRTHQDWTQAFLAAPTVLGVIDTYGIELIHPMREGRSPQQSGRKGLSNHRWIVGGKLCLLLNQWGLIVAWECATANVVDNTFQFGNLKSA